MFFVYLIAEVLLSALLFAASLANYWYVFGLWPRSWGLYFLFWAATILIVVVQVVVRRIHETHK